MKGRCLERSVLCAWAALVLACGAGAEPDPRVEVALSRALGCRPSRIDSARIEAWGDFPLRDEHVVVTSEGGQRTLPALPLTTRALFFQLEGDMVVRGLGALPDRGGASVVLVLPSDVACPLPDPEVQHGPGTATAVLEDGTLVLVGGLDGAGDPRRRVISLLAGAEVGVLAAQPLFNAVAFASATPLSARTLLVAGGADDAAGPAHDTFELVDLDAGEGAPRRAGTLASARSDHGALLLASGDVLLVGGRDGSDPVRSIERIGPEAARGVTLGARLSAPRAQPTLVELADGRVVIAGGTTEPLIEVLSPGGDTSEPLDLGLPLPRTVLALPGQRLLWIAEDGAAHVVLLDGAPAALPLGLSLPLGPAAVGRASVVAIHDPAAMRPERVELDREGRLTRRPSSRAASALVALPDGSFVELDASGASRFLHAIESEVAPPPASYQFPLDRTAILLDAPSRFEDVPGGLRARAAGATLWLPVLTFRGMALTVEVSGDATLRFDPHDPAASIEVLEDRAGRRGPEGALDCEAARAPGAPVSIVRAGDALTIEAGAAAVTCDVPLPDRVSVGLSLAAGTELASLALARR